MKKRGIYAQEAKQVKKMKAVINGKIVTPEEVVLNKVLVLDEGKIVAFADAVPDGAEVIDAQQKIVAPGFVDVHIHGSMGCDVMDGTLCAIEKIAKGIAQYGTTSFLPTTMTMEKKAVYDALETIRQYRKEKRVGAQVLGAHLEGPFINVRYKGAQNEAFIVRPDYAWIHDFSDVIKLVTYAPELDAGFAFTKQVKAKTDVCLSMGHSHATYAQAVDAIAHGCSHVTHLFNGMAPLHHRDPGLLGAALTQDVYVELIADKVHVAKELFQFVLQNKGAKRVVLVTDSMRAGCMKDGSYDLGGQTAHVKDGIVRLEDGALAGSVLTLNQAVKHYFEHTNATLPEAIAAASLNPATSIGVHDQKGSLEIGKDADLILLDDRWNCHLTLVKGETVYQR